ncbi:hypothetical protein [Corallococcus macrosporus]|nr:hypothetical protein [Corallococcus macrosporus]
MSVFVLGLAACGGVEAPPTEALVSSESQLTCESCGGARYSDFQAGVGYTCPEARQAARSTLALNLAQDCPGGPATWCGRTASAPRWAPTGMMDSRAPS